MKFTKSQLVLVYLLMGEGRKIMLILIIYIKPMKLMIDIKRMVILVPRSIHEVL